MATHQKSSKKSGGFQSMGLIPTVFRGVMRKGYKVPSKIQRKTIPLILAGADVVAMAPTGSGKTAAFLIPMLQKLREHVPGAGVRGLILSPTRDLAIQTLKFTKQLGRFTVSPIRRHARLDVRKAKYLSTSLLVGGDSMEDQFEELSHNPDIIIATPGRLMHHLAEVDGMSLRTVEYIVFDEADSLFGMGFAEQLHSILQQLSETRQTLLFSATLPKALAEFAKAGLRDPQLVRLDDGISPDLKLAFFTVRPEEKTAALLYLVREQIASNQQTMIFTSTKHHVEFLNTIFKEEGVEPSVSYGDMDQDARKIHISNFRSRKTMILIVTDIAARGLDIPLLDNVVNYDFPPKPKLFIHRVGRVARAGRTGTAYSFVTPEDMPYLLDLHLFLSKPLRPAPREEEVLRNTEEVYSKIDQALANGETVYGRFPQTVIDLVSERVREVIDNCTELITLQKTCANAFRLYTKTKPTPSSESIKRTKDLPREGLHPIFRSSLGSNELTALAFTERLKSFKPKQTILEFEAEAAKSKNAQGANQCLDIMRKKRAVHEHLISLVQQKRSTDTRPKEEKEEDTLSKDWDRKEVCGLKRKVESFKDDEYYISSIPTNQHHEAGLSVKNNDGFVSNRLDAAVLDLVADDNSGMQKQKALYHWDKKAKKYVKLNNGERVTASGKIKTESGAVAKAGKTGIYKKWKQQSHKQISLDGKSTEEVSRDRNSHAGGDRMRGKRWQYKGGKHKRQLPNADVSSEIKDAEQVRKGRQEKASRISLLKGKSSKGRKHNSGGGSGKGNGKGKMKGKSRGKGK